MDKNPWDALLGADDPSAESLNARLVRKRGRPLLLLPADARLAAETLALYPAQSFKAQLARRVLRAALIARLPIGSETLSLRIARQSAFVRFLQRVAGTAEDTLPPLGVLAGNPNVPGQRFIFLVFDSTGKAAAIVKAGTTERARELIEREKYFLTNAPKHLPSIPALRDAFESAQAAALALDFVTGDTPASRDEAQISAVLNSWVDPSHRISIKESRVWMELRRTSHPLLDKLGSRFGERQVRSTIFHGDFAPWNIKISSAGIWKVFDWERGDVKGLPAYDWFHYLIQTRILVAHQRAGALIDPLEGLLSSPGFERYAASAEIGGIERELALLYLLHHNEVIQPAEGLNEGRQLLEQLTRHWLK